MKGVLFSCFLIMNLTGLITTANAQDPDIVDPRVYIDYINKQQANVIKKFLVYNSAISHGKRAHKVERLREKLLKEVLESKMNIATLPQFGINRAYRDTAVSFLRLYYEVLNTDYGQMERMEETAANSYEEMQAFIQLEENIDAKLNDANKRMREAQQQFATENYIRLVESSDEISKMMQQTAEVNKYYNELYLIFFKPYKQEEKLIKSIDSGDAGALEQDKALLLKFAQDGLEQLAAKKDFKDDRRLIDACTQVLQFYVNEAEDNMKVLTDYFLTKDKFLAIKKEHDKRTSHSQEEIDLYNKVIKDINEAGRNFNTTNNSLNLQRAIAVNNWNAAVDAFIDARMPRY